MRPPPTRYRTGSGNGYFCFLNRSLSSLATLDMFSSSFPGNLSLELLGFVESPIN